MSERTGVQKPILKYAQDLGWEIVSRADAETLRGFNAIGGTVQERAKNSSLFFDDILYQKAKEFNPKLEDKKGELVRKLSVLQNDIKGNRDFLEYLKGNKTFFSRKDNREYNLTLINFTEPDKNVYKVTDEYYFNNGRYGNREDIVFLINGIPIVVVECKSATVDEAIAISVDQLRRYHSETPEMMVPQQMFTATESLGFSYGVTWNLSRRSIFNWKHEEVGRLEDKVKSFFAKERIRAYLKNYILFVEKEEELNKYILAQHQAHAIEKVIERAHDAKKYRGLVWHTQGSGKTFTMIKIAETLFKAPESEKPTILMIIDRNELEDQLIRNLKSVGIDHAERADRIDALNRLLKDDYRGILVTMIHKFQGMPANVNLRKNIYVLIDEAHRTTSGDLGNYLMAAIPNATFIGFTGTPIDKTAYGRGTFKTFGIDDKKGYLDKYSIADSIKDGTTVDLFHSFAPNNLLVPKDILEKEFWSLAEAEGVSDIEELNRILERAINTRNFLKGKERVDKVAKFVADHYQNYVESQGYKAFLVGVDREACALYKKALDKYLPPEYSAVVYTSGHNDPPHLKEFYLSEDDEKKLRKAFVKQDTLPKILIVTEKLLTGYDAPVLYAMYLDKPMRDHTLLQAIARVNRPYENEEKNMKKPHGFVLDFIGIFDRLEKALAFDSEEVSAVIKDLNLLKGIFKKRMENNAPAYLKLVSRPMTDKDTDKLIDYFKNESRRKEFYKLYKELESLYEIISPDVFLRPYVEDYGFLTEIYFIVRNAFAKKINVDREFLRKTNQLVKDRIGIDGITGGVEIFPINEDTLKTIKNKNQGNNVKIINLIKSIEKYIDENSGDITLIPLATRAQEVEEKYERRQEETARVLEELTALIENELERKKEQKAKGFDDLTSFVYSVLVDKKIKMPEETAKEIRTKFDDFLHWRSSKQEERDLRLALYEVLNSVVGDFDICVPVIDHLFEMLEKASGD
ncbi:MAG: HsdR family type I site-specific deoxyribonuclease [Candidatus Omnitrophica bacterium]|nr:HsdR family type I site-specific deoxyribonuclease [Candidatus Omnitrophota bacterium]